MTVAHQARVDVFCRACTREPQLEHEATFQHHRISEHSNDTRHEAIENDELAVDD